MLETDYDNYCSQGYVYISGDFNSRTSDYYDYFHFDRYICPHMYDNDLIDIPTRLNMDRTIDSYGRKLLDLCCNTGLLIVNGRLYNDRTGEFTCCSNNGLSTVDYLLTSYECFSLLSNFTVLHFNEFSDHAPLHFSFHKYVHEPEVRTNEYVNPPRIKWDSSKFPQFNNLLSDKILRIRETMTSSDYSIDHVVTQLTDVLNETAFSVFDSKTQGQGHPRARGLTTPKKKWFNSECATARKEFRRYRNIFINDKNDANRELFVKARTKYNKVKNKAKNNYKKEEGIRINNLAKSAPRKFWKNIKTFIPKDKNDADSLSVDDLLTHFKNMFGEEATINEDANTTHMFENNNMYEEFFDCDITEDELRSAVLKQNNNKAPGFDGLPAEIFKNSLDILSPILLQIYNHIYSTGHYPKAWGEGIIAPIYKKGDPNKAENYRGTTLINILGKIYSQILLNRLTKWSTTYEHLNKSQFGFQKNKSILDCIFILHSVINKVLSAGGKLYCCFIDYERCFDKIERNFLWTKLLTQNIHCKMVKALKAMYSCIRSCIRYKGKYSQFFYSFTGLKQGDPSSPLLYMMFVNDIMDNINTDIDDLFTYDELKVFLLLYADDQAVFAKSPRALQSLLNDIENYSNTWKLRINTNKTKVMIFERGRHTQEEFYLYNTKLELVDSFKYLGINFYKNGSWHRSQKDVAKHASFALSYFQYLVTSNFPFHKKLNCSIH